MTIASGNGTIDDNNDGTWTYTPVANDDTEVSFDVTITDGANNVVGSATLDITPVNDAPTTMPVTLTAIVEDSGPRTITEAELLAGASDIDSATLTVINVTIASGNGTIDDNNCLLYTSPSPRDS